MRGPEVISAKEQYVRQKAREIRSLIQVQPKGQFAEAIEKGFLSERYIAAVIRICLKMVDDAPMFTHVISDHLRARESAILIHELVNLMRVHVHGLPPERNISLEAVALGQQESRREEFERYLSDKRYQNHGYDYSQVLFITELVTRGTTIDFLRGVFAAQGLALPRVAAIEVWQGLRRFACDYVGDDDALNREQPYWNAAVGQFIAKKAGFITVPGKVHPARPEPKLQSDLDELDKVLHKLAQTIFWELFRDRVKQGPLERQ